MIKKSVVKGFTLVELIMVMAVLGVLVAAVIFLINPIEQFRKTADAQRKNDLAQIQRAIESYYQDYGKYPAASNYKIVYQSQELTWGNTWAPYIDVLPKDPETSRTYIYITPLDGQSYQLYASLERAGRDPQACKGDGSSCDGAAGVNCGSTNICNYGVSSPNVSP